MRGLVFGTGVSFCLPFPFFLLFIEKKERIRLMVEGI